MSLGEVRWFTTRHVEIAGVLDDLAHRGLARAPTGAQGDTVLVIDAEGRRGEWTVGELDAALRAGQPVAAQLWCGPDSDVLLTGDGDDVLVFDLDGLSWGAAQAVVSLVLACALGHGDTLGVVADRHLPDGAQAWRAAVVDGAQAPHQPDLLLLRAAESPSSESPASQRFSHRLSLREDSWWSAPTS